MLLYLSFNHHTLIESIVQRARHGRHKDKPQLCLLQTGGILYVKNNAKVNAKPQARHAEHGEVEGNWGFKFGHAFAQIPALI